MGKYVCGCVFSLRGSNRRLLGGLTFTGREETKTKIACGGHPDFGVHVWVEKPVACDRMRGKPKAIRPPRRVPKSWKHPQPVQPSLALCEFWSGI